MSDEILASDIIKSNTGEYAKHILINLFPNVVDGLKKVRRRILYTQPHDDSFSGLQLISNTIRIHPFGDSSIYDAACNMTEDFRFTFPLLTLIGKGGSYGGDNAASARYTKFKLSDFCKDVFFNGVNFKTIPMESTEDLTGREIQYFIPRIPTALLISNESIGFGYSSRTVPLKFENICDITIDYVSCKDKLHWNYSKIAHKFVPCLPIQVGIKNEPEVIAAYTKGNFEYPIETEGKYVILSNNSVLFRTVGYGESPSAIRTNITKAIRDKNHWLAKMEASFDALSSDIHYVDFRITIKRGGNIFDLIEQIKGILRIRTSAHVINNFVFNEMLVPTNPPGIVQIWYKERYRSIFGSKKHKQQELQLVRMRLETYLIVCEHVDDVIAIIRKEKSKTVDDVYEDLKQRFGLSTRQCEVLVNSNLQILMRSKRSELEEKLAKVVADMEAINLSFKNIDDEICEEVKYLKKKYKTDTRFTSYESKFIGALIVGELGIKNVESVSEIVDTARLFSNHFLKFIPYYSGIKSIKFAKQLNEYKRVQALPLTSNMHEISIQYKQRQYLFIREDKRGFCVPNDTPISADRTITNYISDKPFVITADGNIEQSNGGTLNKKRVNNVLYAFDTIGDITEYIVISVNAAHPNVVRFQLITLGNGKVMFSGAGETSVIGVVPLSSDDVIVNLPAFHKSNFLLITNIQSYVKKNKLADINIRSFERF